MSKVSLFTISDKKCDKPFIQNLELLFQVLSGFQASLKYALKSVK